MSFLPFCYQIMTSKWIFQGTELPSPSGDWFSFLIKLAVFLIQPVFYCCNNKSSVNSISRLLFRCFKCCQVVHLEAFPGSEHGLNLGAIHVPDLVVFKLYLDWTICFSKKYLQRCLVNKMKMKSCCCWVWEPCLFLACIYLPVAFTCYTVATE